MKPELQKKHYDVIVIGGGATGAGTARDCAKRGLSVLLIERFDFTAGATGRNHGLLHSGARYAVTDHESASECIKENMILRKIAAHCVEETGGLFVTLPEDDLAYQKTFIDSCLAAGIQARELDPRDVVKMEPAVNPDIIGAVSVPDGAVDPFRLTTANVLDARIHGADILTYHEVVDLLQENGRITGVKVRDVISGEETEHHSDIVENAGGIWSHGIALKAGIKINMFPAKGSLLIFGHRVNNMVINRCRKPADADILVPGDTISLIGTTSSRIPYEECDNMEVTQEEVDILLNQGCQLVPSLAWTRILRLHHHLRGQAHDLPSDGRDRYRYGLQKARTHRKVHHPYRPAPGISAFGRFTVGQQETYHCPQHRPDRGPRAPRITLFEDSLQQRGRRRSRM